MTNATGLTSPFRQCPGGGRAADDQGSLIERARGGDARAFEGVYRAQVGRVYAICLRMCADPALAEELTQEVFVCAWQKLEAYRGEADLSAWLRRIAINTVLSDRRSRARRQDWAWDDRDALASSGPPLRRAEAIDLERAIADLPRGARMVLVLHDIEGHTHAEIGALLEIATATSKSQLHRARKLLREVLR